MSVESRAGPHPEFCLRTPDVRISLFPATLAVCRRCLPPPNVLTGSSKGRCRRSSAGQTHPHSSSFEGLPPSADFCALLPPRRTPQPSPTGSTRVRARNARHRRKSRPEAGLRPVAPPSPTLARDYPDDFPCQLLHRLTGGAFLVFCLKFDEGILRPGCALHPPPSPCSFSGRILLNPRAGRRCAL
jgi:hypothetical protein